LSMPISSMAGGALSASAVGKAVTDHARLLAAARFGTATSLGLGAPSPLGEGGREAAG